MIDVSQIKDLPQLQEMKDDLNFFINKKIVADIYTEQGKEKIELILDRELARELLAKVLKRINQLGGASKVRTRAPAKISPEFKS